MISTRTSSAPAVSPAPHAASAGRPGRLSEERVARLVRGAARGDQRSWDELVGEFGGLVWAVARAHRLSHADASDVTQMTWLRLLEHLGQISEPRRLGAWLATTARRECLRVLRRAERQVVCGEDMPEPRSPAAPVGDDLLLAERDAALWEAFGRLRASDQALLRLLMASPRPAYNEIAGALDMPIGSIGPTRSRALARLHHALERRGTLSLLAA